MPYTPIRVCQVCGASFTGSPDQHYCPKCAKIKKQDTVVKERVCEDCGKKFYGGPRARRCPECAYAARQKTDREHKRRGTMRPLGSTDKCVICGAEYTVLSGRQKYCSQACQRIGVLAWQREHKKGYNIVSGQGVKKQKRREEQQRVCAYCLRPFTKGANWNTCSEYCKKERLKMQMCETDIRRGRKRDLQSYIDAMTAYREQVKDADNPGK